MGYTGKGNNSGLEKAGYGFGGILAGAHPPLLSIKLF